MLAAVAQTREQTMDVVVDGCLGDSHSGCPGARPSVRPR